MLRPPAAAWRLLDAGRTLGPARLLAIGPAWAVRPVYLVITRDLRVASPAPGRPVSLGWTTLAAGEAAALAGLNPALSRRQIDRRLAEGQECRLGWLDTGELVHYWWETIRPARVPSLGLEIRPDAGDIFFVEDYTHAAFRGRGIHVTSSIAALERARARGLVRSIALIAPWNAPSLRVPATGGRRVVGAVGCWRLGRWRRFFVRGEVVLEGARIRIPPAGAAPGTRPA